MLTIMTVTVEINSGFSFKRKTLRYIYFFGLKNQSAAENVHCLSINNSMNPCILSVSSTQPHVMLATCILSDIICILPIDKLQILMY